MRKRSGWRGWAVQRLEEAGAPEEKAVQGGTAVLAQEKGQAEKAVSEEAVPAERAAQAGLTVPEEKTEPVREYPQYPMSSTRKPITAPER